MACSSCAIACAGAASLSSCALGQISFVDSSVGAGFEQYVMAAGMAAGVAAEDFDADGDIDLFVPNGLGYGDQLYVNQGDGTFVDMAPAMGLASTWNSRGAVWFDYDNDRDLDLLVVSDFYLQPSGAGPTSIRLWRNDGGGSFTDMSAQAGVSGVLYEGTTFGFLSHVGGITAADLDRDGFLDFLVTYWQPPAYGAYAHLYMNAGDGTFVDRSLESGLNPVDRSHWQPVIHDFNRDGWPDIFMALDYDPNQLWLNRKDGTFNNVAVAAGCANAWNDMGVALGDFDRDGDFDVMVTNIQADENAGNSYAGRHNVFYRNDTVGASVAFAEISEACGVADGDWGWGVTFIDADCDGWLDIAQTNGFNEPGYQTDPSRLFHSMGGEPVMFQDESPECGVSDTNIASCMIAVDVDRDGDLDLIQTTAGHQIGQPGLRLYENRSMPLAGDTGAAYLVVRPRMHGGNWWAIGTEIRVRTGSVWHARLIMAGTSMLGQEPSEAHFGLGDATVVDEILVSWPDGRETVLSGIGVNQLLDVELRCRGDVEGDGDTDVFDFGTLAANFATFGHPALEAGDLDGDGDVDVFDFAILAADFSCQ